MKIFICIIMLCMSIAVAAQEPASAIKGASYGAGTTANGAIAASQMTANMKDSKFTGKITGKVVSVCQEKGCWMRIENGNNGTIMVKFKDYAFFMPRDIAGKEVVIDGEATVAETSVKQQKHYAADAKRSKEEIAAIKTPQKELIFIARGVLVL